MWHWKGLVVVLLYIPMVHGAYVNLGPTTSLGDGQVGVHHLHRRSCCCCIVGPRLAFLFLLWKNERVKAIVDTAVPFLFRGGFVVAYSYGRGRTFHREMSPTNSAPVTGRDFTSNLTKSLDCWSFSLLSFLLILFSSYTQQFPVVEKYSQSRKAKENLW